MIPLCNSSINLPTISECRKATLRFCATVAHRDVGFCLRKIRVKKNCKTCGNEFNTKPSRVKRGCGLYCCMECSRQSHAYTVTRIESLRRRVEGFRVKRACNWCGVEFTITKRSLITGKHKGVGKFCSLRCMWNARPKKEKHHLWKGSKISKIQEIRASLEMKAWRTAVLKRDGFKCKSCGQVGGDLHTHHKLPFICFPLNRLDVNNGETLCRACHRKTPTGREIKREFPLFYRVFNSKTQTEKRSGVK